MDSFELNKILGAVLGTCLVLLVTSFTAGAIFAPVMPEKPGFEIAVKEEAPWRRQGSRGRALRADREAAADRLGREGRSCGQEVRRLPHLRKGWPQPRRPESVRDRRRPEGRGARVQFLGGHEGQGRHLDL